MFLSCITFYIQRLKTISSTLVKTISFKTSHFMFALISILYFIFVFVVCFYFVLFIFILSKNIRRVTHTHIQTYINSVEFCYSCVFPQTKQKKTLKTKSSRSKTSLRVWLFQFCIILVVWLPLCSIHSHTHKHHTINISI